MLPILGGGGVVLGIILYFVLGKSDAAKPKAPDPQTPVAEEQPASDDSEDSPPVTPPPTQAVQPVQQDTQNRVDPNAVAADLERALKNHRLWSNVDVVGKDVQLTTGSCRDASLLPTINAAAQALRNAGLTRVRCLENSGAVVFERAL
jgi:cytoskeletal protein RodZ